MVVPLQRIVKSLKMSHSVSLTELDFCNRITGIFTGDFPNGLRAMDTYNSQLIDFLHKLATLSVWRFFFWENNQIMNNYILKINSRQQSALFVRVTCVTWTISVISTTHHGLNSPTPDLVWTQLLTDVLKLPSFPLQWKGLTV